MGNEVGKIYGILIVSGGGIPIYENFIDDPASNELLKNLETTLLSAMLIALEKFSKEIHKKNFEQLDFGVFKIFFHPTLKTNLTIAIITNHTINKKDALVGLAKMADGFNSTISVEQILGASEGTPLEVNDIFDNFIIETIKQENDSIFQNHQKKKSIRDQWF